MAPEIMFNKPYDAKVDIWALGVMLYVFLSGYLPFQGENRQQLASKIKQGAIHFQHSEFKQVSKESMDLIEHMLHKDHKKRYSAQQAMQHPWFKLEQKEINNTLDINILKNLQAFKGQSKLKKAAMNLLVKMADTKAIENLKQEFHKIDKDRTGLIHASELKSAMQNIDNNIP